MVPSETLLKCDPRTVRLGGSTTCTADVITPDGSKPTGSVAFSSSGPGSFSDIRCGVNDDDNSLGCNVKYTPR